MRRHRSTKGFRLGLPALPPKIDTSYGERSNVPSADSRAILWKKGRDQGLDLLSCCRSNEGPPQLAKSTADASCKNANANACPLPGIIVTLSQEFFYRRQRKSAFCVKRRFLESLIQETNSVSSILSQLLYITTLFNYSAKFLSNICNSYRIVIRETNITFPIESPSVFNYSSQFLSRKTFGKIVKTFGTITELLFS